MHHFTIQIVDGEVSHPLMRLNNRLNLELNSDEHLAIVGLNGAGKSLLVNVLLGKYALRKGKMTYDFSPSPTTAAYQNIQYLEFRDGYGVADSTYYYQQRWNSWDTDEYPTVKEFLNVDSLVDGILSVSEIIHLLRLEELFSKRIVFLSSGELRRVQLARVLFRQPRILILDNPLIGLDVPTRTSLLTLLNHIAQFSNLQLIVVMPTGETLPDFITHVLPIEDKSVQPKRTKQEYLKNYTLNSLSSMEWKSRIAQSLNSLVESNSQQVSSSTEIVRFNKVSLGYDGVQILKNMNWVIHKGEKWKLTGENGTGKSALLSLIYADNPQSYAQDLYLFGKKRGTGESIWDIKSRIGYLSPEMHRSFLKPIPVMDTVASGLHNHLGLFKKITPEEQAVCLFWMKLFNIDHLKDQSFLQLSSGEQRLTLLARAFIKNPELLILDEPFHGLDVIQSQKVKQIIESYSLLPDKTLIMVTHNKQDFPKIMTHSLHLEKNNLYLITKK